jgi:UDP-MurNAc hydroxylase
LNLTYYGQACTLIEAAGRRILTDPWLTEGAYFGTWYHTHVLKDLGVTPEAVARRKPDYLFLSHEHHDHVDEESLRAFPRDIPILICRFPSARFRSHVEAMGFTNIRELDSGRTLDLGDSLRVTVFGSAEYTNDSAILVEGEDGVVFNETDCKLDFDDLELIAEKKVDIGFYMFSGANWYPMMYDYAAGEMCERVRTRRAKLLTGFVNRVKVTRPRFAVPSAGPCSTLSPELMWLNSPERGIFIDPQEAVDAIRAAGLPVEPLYMASTDTWDVATGYRCNTPDSIRANRPEYLARASHDEAPVIRDRQAAERPAGGDLAKLLPEYFDARVRPLAPEVRRRIGAKVAIDVEGPRGGRWTLDFLSPGPGYVREGIDPDWTYRMQVEDKLIYPFVSGEDEFLEDMFLSLRVRLSRRPDQYNDPLYNFFYDPDPERLARWYAMH